MCKTSSTPAPRYIDAGTKREPWAAEDTAASPSTRLLSPDPAASSQLLDDARHYSEKVRAQLAADLEVGIDPASGPSETAAVMSWHCAHCGETLYAANSAALAVAVNAHFGCKGRGKPYRWAPPYGWESR